MNVRRHRVAGLVFIGLLVACAWLWLNAMPAQAAGETCSNGSPSPCAEDIQLNGCTACHSIRITGGSRNGSDRVITGSSGVNRHIDDPMIADWTSTVQAMIDKGAPADVTATSGYLNTNYCPTCTGPILGSPVQSAVTDSSATVTWSTSYIGFEDEPTNTVLFYGTVKADVLACTNTSGCPGVTAVVQDGGTPVAHHAVGLTGLTAFTVYYMVNQATSASHGTTRSTYATSFKTKAFLGGGGTIIPKLYAYDYYDDTEIGAIDYNVHSNIFVIDPISNSIITSFPAGAATGAGEMASHPDGTAVYFMADSTLKVIQTEDDTVPATLLGAGGTSNQLTVSGNGQRLYLAYVNAGDSKVKIKVYDTTDPLNPALVTTISNATLDSCAYPIGLAVQPDGGGRLYMACHGSPDQLIMVDTSTYASTQTATFAADSNSSSYNAMAILPGGSQLYVVRSGYPGTSTVEIFNGTTGSSSGSIALPAGASPVSAVTSIEGSLLFVQDYLGIHVIDTAGHAYLETMDPATSAGLSIAIYPDGSRLFSSIYPIGTQISVNDPSDYSNIGAISVYCAVDCYESLYQITVTPGHGAALVPDLVMTAVTPNAGTVAAGNTLSLSDTVKNQGTGATGTSFFIGYHLSTNATYGDGDDIPILTTRVVDPMDAGDTDSDTTALLIPGSVSPGLYHVCALADATAAVAESNTDNNTLCSAATVQVTRPDLVVNAVSPNAGSFAPGGTLSVTDSVQNIGGASTGASSIVAYSLSSDATYGNGDDVPVTTTRGVGILAAGASSTATTTLLIPNSTPLGTYHICAKADSGDAVSESDETNNSLCSTATVGPAAPDLIVSAASTATTGIAPGKSFSLSNTAKNQGAAGSGSFVIAFHLSTNAVYGDGDDIVLTATRTVTSLGVGATSTASTSLAVPAATPLGTYYICAFADRDNTVTESDETNNSNCTDTIQVSGPDLIVTDVTPNAPAVSSTGTLQVINTVKNQDVVAAGSFTVGFDLSPTASYDDPGAIAIATTRSVVSLAGGLTNTATTTLTIPNTTPPGVYYVCAKADSAGTSLETNETNNTLCSTATVSVPAPDLIVSAASTTATALSAGTSFALSNTVQNTGGFPAGSFTVVFHLSTNTTFGDGDDIVLTGTRTVTSLGAGKTSTASTTLTVPSGTPVGSYYVCAMADGGAAVTESSETNNVLCTSTPVQASGVDLIMTEVTPTASTVNQGGALLVTNTAKNQGLIAAGAFKIAYHLSTNATYGDGDDIPFTVTRLMSSLAAGASSTATTSLTVPTTLPPGAYYICAMADSLSAVPELDEANNTLCSAATVTVPSPDLIISAASTAAITLAAGKNITLSNTVKNQGGASAGSFTIGYHLSTNTTFGDGDDVAITQTRSVTSLAINGTSSASSTLTVPASTSPGSYYVCAMADSGNTVTESNETNNSLCTASQIQVSVPDLILTAVTPSVSTANQNASFSVTSAVKNQGLLAAGAFKIAFSLSQNTTYGDGDDVAITAVRSVSSLAAGASSSATTTVTVPATTPPGTYYVCAMADSLGAVSELDETNNTLCSATTVTVPPPDLIMTATTMTTATLAAGSNFTLSNTAKNQGGSSAGSFMIGYHLSTNTTFGDGDDIVITQTRPVASLAVNATSANSTTLTVPAATSPGSYYVCANADDNNDVAEGNEANNARCTTNQITVSP